MFFIYVVFLISTHTPGPVTLLVLGVLTETFDTVRTLDWWLDVLEGCGSTTFGLSICEEEFVVSRNKRRLSRISTPSKQLARLDTPLLFRGLDSTSE